ncbi:hypothetical protein [Phormidium sp. FACHB-1136]|uniref:hypothetical protein n=1 Tax=Phormidium sp. FACHB-1136 TaxID=2692848 RepID=UPI001689F330|nr:hypothetical protein [Phormidium sp. FACHB-1136]MBD2426640.1 hypothetical protein [Phormidium sp. FACHB-1136]
MNSPQGFIIDSNHFFEIAKNGYRKASEGFEIQRQHDAIVAIVFSAFTLEAFINELLAIAKNVKESGVNESSLDLLINAIEENDGYKSTQNKFFLASQALESQFDKGQNPYQDFADLFRLRDCLVHLKPEDLIEASDNQESRFLGRRLARKLRSKGIVQQYTSIESITLLISTAKAAKWACKTASNMANTILDQISTKILPQDHEVLIVYREIFYFSD